MKLLNQILSYLIIIICLYGAIKLINQTKLEDYKEKINIKHYVKEEKWLTATFTAYNLEEGQTDSNPFVGANGEDLRKYLHRGERICASRKYKMETKISIKGIGDCIIKDKTSKKYSERIDILMDTKQQAINFGRQELEYIIIK